MFSSNPISIDIQRLPAFCMFHAPLNHCFILVAPSTQNKLIQLVKKDVFDTNFSFAHQVEIKFLPSAIDC